MNKSGLFGTTLQLVCRELSIGYVPNGSSCDNNTLLGSCSPQYNVSKDLQLTDCSSKSITKVSQLSTKHLHGSADDSAPDTRGWWSN